MYYTWNNLIPMGVIYLARFCRPNSRVVYNAFERFVEDFFKVGILQKTLFSCFNKASMGRYGV